MPLVLGRLVRSSSLRSVLAVALVAGLNLAATSGSGDPELREPAEDLQAALTCPDAFDVTDDREPVLLVHGTFTNARENYSWNFMSWLEQDGYDVCWVDLPSRSLIDIQVQAEYIVHAVRTIAAATGEQVDIIGHSQGGLQPRWAIRWWPETVRPHVDDLVLVAVPNQGTALADGCHQDGSSWMPYGCFPSAWQMARVSTFIELLSGGDPSPGDVSYTSIYTTTDELVQPQLPTSVAALDGASNIAIQHLCPGRPADHLSIIGDGVTYELAVQAFANDAPGLDGAAVAPTDPLAIAALCAQTVHGPSEGFSFEDGQRFFGDISDPSLFASSDGEPEPAPYTQGDGGGTTDGGDTTDGTTQGDGGTDGGDGGATDGSDEGNGKGKAKGKDDDEDRNDDEHDDQDERDG